MKRLRASQLWQLAQCSLRGWVDDAAPSMGAALAFYTLFSLAPLLVVVITLAGFFMGESAARDALVAQLTQMIGANATAGIEALLDTASSREGGRIAMAVGVVTLLLGATTVLAELKADLNRIWRHRPASGGARKFIKARLLAFAIVAAAGALLLASVVASTLLASAGKRWFPEADALLHVGEFAISFTVLTGLFAMIYKLLPGPRLEWGDVWVGAAVTAVLFWVGKLAIALYMAKAAMGEAFGAAGAIVVVVAWVYYSSQAFFLGAEFTRQYALRHGSKRNDPVDRRRPFLVSSDAALVARAERLVRGEDPVLERPRRQA
jgi:membrane protein